MILSLFTNPLTQEAESLVINEIAHLLEKIAPGVIKDVESVWHEVSTDFFGKGDVNTIVHNAISGTPLDPNTSPAATTADIQTQAQ